ncbi:response regulator transcription factor [Patescibacteria group bacterium]|nr:response regulator transcription factor [Patescibacteria group bacterium]
MNSSILIVEDDKEFQKYLKDLLIKNGFTVQTASRGISAIGLVEKLEPDLIILDLNLPDMHGEGVCQEIRKDHPNLPIIMLTAKTATSDKVQGFNMGADDYITKPFIVDEFLARVKVRLKQKNNVKSTLKIADLELDNKKVQVRRGHKLINLTPHEFKLLEYLIYNKGMVLTREMILNRIWAYSLNVESRVVDVYMGYLRKKIDNNHKKKLIHCIRGFGYTIRD